MSNNEVSLSSSTRFDCIRLSLEVAAVVDSIVHGLVDLAQFVNREFLLKQVERHRRTRNISRSLARAASTIS